jgi:hypothetical protein
LGKSCGISGSEGLQFEVLKPQVDDSGYDLVLEANGVVRHVQLKASSGSASTVKVSVSLQLVTKPSACVIWVHFDPQSMSLGPFLWFGNLPGKPLANIADWRVTKQTRANALGFKAPRQNRRDIPRSKFESVDDIEGLVSKLFGLFELPPLEDISQSI